jgi:hypothetical protein
MGRKIYDVFDVAQEDGEILQHAITSLGEEDRSFFVRAVEAGSLRTKPITFLTGLRRRRWKRLSTFFDPGSWSYLSSVRLTHSRSGPVECDLGDDR